MRLFKNRTEKAGEKKRWAFWRWCDIFIDGDYLTRLTIFTCPWFSVKLHWIHKPDPDRGLHDHPWPFVSFILRGWYKELVCSRPDLREAATQSGIAGLVEIAENKFPIRERLVRWINYKNTRSVHRITEVSPKLLTLVITGRSPKSWGFYDEETFKFTPWREYTGKM